MSSERTGPPSRPSGTSLTLRDFAIAALLGILATVLTWQRVMPEGVGLYNDDGVYVVTAKALASGHGYRLLHAPGEPLQTKYPPLYPIVLAGIWLLRPDFPANVLVLKAVGTFLAALGMGLFYLCIVGSGLARRTAAGLGVAAAVSTPHLIHLLALTMSETLFLPLLAGALWATERLSAGPAQRRPGLETLAGGLVAACVLTRSIGLFVAVGLSVSLLFRGRLSRGFVFAAWIPVVSWFGWSAWAATDQRSLMTAYTTNYVRWWSLLATDAPWLVLWTNVKGFVFTMAIFGFEGLRTFVAGSAWPATLVLLLAAAFWAVVGAWLRRARTPTSTAITCYLLCVLVWPWPPLRFIVPLLPLLFPMVLEWLLRLPGTRSARAAIAAAALSIAISIGLTNIAASWRTGRQQQATRYPVDPVPVPPPAWSSMSNVLDTIRRATPTTAVIAGMADPMVYLYTGRHAVLSNRMDAVKYMYKGEGPTTEEFRAYLRAVGATHVVVQPVPFWKDAALTRDWQERHRSELTTLYQGADPRFRLYVIQWHPSTSIRQGVASNGALR